MWQILICGALILTLSMGVRHGFGLWLLPMTQAQHWGREDFAFAMAIQNIAWGVGGIFSGMLSDQFGAFRVILFCALLYVLGLFGMAHSSSPEQLTASAGMIIGLAQAGTTYAVIYGLIGRNISPDKRSWAMGFAAAAGSFGQFLMVPVEGWLINQFGWQQALVLLACLATLVIPLAFGLREKQFENGAPLRRQQSILQALQEAFSYRSFQLLTLGYFVCGFQVVFIGVHMPSYLKDQGLEPHVASTALALIGLFNIIGTYSAGVLGQKISKNKILSSIYFSRAIVILWFISVPLSPLTVYIFSACMGVLWLSTVPPTNAVVASIFGVSHMAMLSGFVFLSHQLGSFTGVWLGGYLFDLTGSYTIVWQICIALGIFSGLVNLPVKESPIQRLATV
ncbi:MAG: MFS transporter [Limnohabitans sp.]|nr:MFS transporter [Limnohabitans sp.]